MNLLATALSILFLFATFFFFPPSGTELHLENIWKHVLDLPQNPVHVTNTSKLIRWATSMDVHRLILLLRQGGG